MPRDHYLFTNIVNEMKYIDRLCYRDSLNIMQDEIILDSMFYCPDAVGEHLRLTSSLITTEAEDLMEATIEPFRKLIEKLIDLKSNEVIDPNKLKELFKEESNPEEIRINESPTNNDTKSISSHEEKKGNDKNSKSTEENSEIKGGATSDSQPTKPTRESALANMENAIIALCNGPESEWEQLVDLAVNDYENSLSIIDKSKNKSDALLWAHWGFNIRSTNYKGSWREARKCYELAEMLDKNLTGACAGKALTFKRELLEAEHTLREFKRKATREELDDISVINGLVKSCADSAKRLRDRKGICRNSEPKSD